VSILGVDYGLKRIGLAFSDPDARIAFPGPVVTGSEEECIAEVAREAASRGADEIVVGRPVHMSGGESAMSVRAEAFAEALRGAAGVPVVMWDERLTSAQAERAMLSGDLSRKKRKKRIDSLAAQLMLQNYLDFRQSRSEA